MNGKKKWILSGARLMAAMVAVALAAPSVADDYWDTSKRVDAIPASAADGGMAGLDARARGFDSSNEDKSIDVWYWSQALSNECGIRCTLPRGLMLILK